MMAADGVRKRDGIHALPPREKISEPARMIRECYAITPGAPIFQREFGFMEGTKDRWRSEGMPDPWPFPDDPEARVHLGHLGWTEPAYAPEFDTKVLEDRGEYELAQDAAGRAVLYFKGRRQGFMPEYVDHPVKDQKSWEEDVKWRLDPETPTRYRDLDRLVDDARRKVAHGEMVVANLIGGYMYLRSMIGPEGVLYAVVDQPELIHDCMETWLRLADGVLARFQKRLTIDEIFLAEDICYNRGPLISPDMMREFLFPYYQQLISGVRSRQIDPERTLHIQIDTDGNVNDVIDVYREIGMNAMSPFEVASGCDVVAIGKRYPDLVMFGGIDKRVLAQGPAEIDAMLERIIPAMRRRGGFIPTCDHAVPVEVSYANYAHYRNRLWELCRE
ncbi:MAG: uroporphyrinogen decarboxylase family protein [Spirochaetota bacterium]